jgi:hypothetical protein
MFIFFITWFTPRDIVTSTGVADAEDDGSFK